MIIIDTPGFNDESVNDTNKFKSYIDVLEFVFSQSSQVHFLVSTDHMLSIGCALHMLQLTLLDPDTKNKVIEIAQQMSSKNETSSGLIEMLLTSAYSMMEMKVKGLFTKGYQTDNSIKHQFFGSSIFEKVYFVINKIDLCKHINYAFYEFGCEK